MSIVLDSSEHRNAHQPPSREGREALPAGAFGDPGITGDTIEGRPGMMALLAAVRAGRVDAVLVRDTDRLARPLNA